MELYKLHMEHRISPNIFCRLQQHIVITNIVCSNDRNDTMETKDFDFLCVELARGGRGYMKRGSLEKK
jgi:hypothetical protein